MSAQTAGPETLGHLTDEPQHDPDSPSFKTVTGKSPMQIALGRLVRDKIAMVCAFIVFVFVMIAIFAGTIANLFNVSTDTVLASTVINGLTGMPKDGPPDFGYWSEHPFGVAPQTGNDNLAYWLYGCRTSMLIAGLATLVASTFGIIVGLVAGFLGGIVDRVLSFVIDLFLTIPFILAALSIAPIINQRYNTSENYGTIQLWALIIVLASFGWMAVARLIRGEVLSLREREFIQAARVLGMPTRRILGRELLPNLAAPIVVAVSLMLPTFVAAEAGLAFLGIGVTDGQSWGQIIRAAVQWFERYPLFLWEPLLGVVALVLSLNLLGDAIRDALDPKTRR